MHDGQTPLAVTAMISVVSQHNHLPSDIEGEHFICLIITKSKYAEICSINYEAFYQLLNNNGLEDDWNVHWQRDFDVRASILLSLSLST